MSGSAAVVTRLVKIEKRCLRKHSVKVVSIIEDALVALAKLIKL